MYKYTVIGDCVCCCKLEWSDKVERTDLCSPTADSKPIYARED